MAELTKPAISKTAELMGVCVCACAPVRVCLFIFNILCDFKCVNDDFLGN